MWVLYAGVVLIWINGIYFYVSGDFGEYTNKGFVAISSLAEGIYYSISNMMSLGIVQHSLAGTAGFSRRF